jgi:hypothetical protein
LLTIESFIRKNKIFDQKEEQSNEELSIEVVLDLWHKQNDE